MSSSFIGCVIGFVAWFLVRYLAAGFYTVNQNERAVKTSFGRAERAGDAMTAQDPIAEQLTAEEKERYNCPQVRVIPPGGPYFKWPWETVYKVSSDISLAQASADQKIVQSKRAVEIETLKAQAEVQPIVALAEQLSDLKQNGAGALDAYVRNVRLKLFSEAKTVIVEADHE